MKSIIKNIFILITIMCLSTAVLGSINAMAEELSVAATYQQSNNSWKISGKAGSKAHKAVTLKIYKSENGSFSADAIANKEGILKLCYTSEGGVFTDVIDFGTFFSSGSYNVEVSCNGFTGASTSFLYVNPDEAASIIEKINDAEVLEEVAQLIKDNCYQLGIDEDEYNEKAACIDEIIFYRRPEAGYTAESFLKEYNSALCVYDLKNSSDTLENLLGKHSESISFDFEKDIKVHGESVTAMLRERLKTENYKLLSVDEAIRENLIVSRIKCAERYTYMEGILSGEISDGVYDLNNYNRVKNKENVFKNIFNNRDEIGKYNDLKTLFETAAETVYKKEKESISGGSGSGGSGSGGSGSGGSGSGKTQGDISIKEAIVNQEEDVLIKVSFSDTESHWADEYIDYMANKKIANGYPDGSFRPEGLVTRAEFVKFVSVAFNLSEKKGDSSFEDVESSDWFYPYVTIAASNGVVNGFEGKFKPDENITRQDAAVILGRLTNEIHKNDSKAFNDEVEISQYAVASVKKLAAMGIIKGSDNNFMPLKNITRAEAAAMIVRLLGE